MLPDSGYVYLVQPAGHNVYKIGATVHLDKRLVRLQRRFDVRLFYVAYYWTADYFRVEESWHTKFSRYSIGKDWFLLDVNQVSEFILISHRSPDHMRDE